MRILVSAIALFAVSTLAPRGGARRGSVRERPAKALLASSDPKLAANKKLVWDMWRDVLASAHHIDEADKFLAPEYHQHNPNAETGLAGVKAYFTRAEARGFAVPETSYRGARLDRRRARPRDVGPRPQRQGQRRQAVHHDVVRHVPRRERQDRRALGYRDEALKLNPTRDCGGGEIGAPLRRSSPPPRVRDAHVRRQRERRFRTTPSRSLRAPD